MKKIRIYKSCITEEQIEDYREATKSIEPCNERLLKESTDELINEGSELMKKEGFKISDNEELRNL